MNPKDIKQDKKTYSKGARAKRRIEWRDHFIGMGHSRKVAIDLAKWAEKQGRW